MLGGGAKELMKGEAPFIKGTLMEAFAPTFEHSAAAHSGAMSGFPQR